VAVIPTGDPVAFTSGVGGKIIPTLAELG